MDKCQPDMRQLIRLRFVTGVEKAHRIPIVEGRSPITVRSSTLVWEGGVRLHRADVMWRSPTLIEVEQVNNMVTNLRGRYFVAGEDSNVGHSTQRMTGSATIVAFQPQTW